MQENAIIPNGEVLMRGMKNYLDASIELNGRPILCAATVPEAQGISRAEEWDE